MNSEANNNNGFPVFKTIYGSFGIFFDNIVSFLLLGSIFSLLFMLVNFISGQSLVCVNSTFNDNIFCSKNVLVFALANILLWFVASVYMRNWCQMSVTELHKFSCKRLVPNKADLKLFGVILIFFVSIFIALASGFFLFTRVPNPDWKIELAYFTFVSMGFFAPFFATPVLSYVSFAAEEEKMPSVKQLWQVSKGKRVLLFISFVSVILLTFFVSSSALQYLMQLAREGNIFVVVIADFLYNIVLMFVATIYINYCCMQKKFLFERS